MSDAQLAHISQQYWDGVWRKRNLDLLDELLSDPYIRHSALGTARLHPAQVKRELAKSWELLDSATTTIDDQVLSGDRIWTRATIAGINLHTGEPSVLTWMVVHRVQDGRIAESWSAPMPGVDWR
jgi:hypothetical protein